KGNVLSYPQEEEAIEVIKKVSKERNAKLTVCPMKNIEILELNDNGALFNYRYKNREYNNIKISLLGEHQVYNATLALTTLLILKEDGGIEITDAEIMNGLKNNRWRGRLEVLKRDPLFVIDGAHNLQGIS